MKRCQNCGTVLPENAQFCVQCGHALSVTTDTPTYLHSSNLMNYAGMKQQATGGSGKDEEEEEKRRRLLLGLPFLGAMTADAPPFAGNVPVVQGTPSTSGVPMVQGTPSIGGASSTQGASAPFNAPSTHELYQTGTSLQPHGVQQPPITQPGQTPPIPSPR